MVEASQVHPTTQYALEAVQGLRVVGHLERLACQRHLDDLARQGTPDFPWVFDEEKADKIFRWFSYCVHIKGPLAKTPIILLPFEEFDLGCIFGWVHKDTGLRRFNKAFILEGRKNAKSTEAAGVADYLMCGDGEESPEVYCAAVDKDQARIVYKIAKDMAMKSADIRKRLKIRNYEISHITRGGMMVPLSKETKNKDGLNPSGAIIDEYHAHPTSEIHDLLWSAWGQRAQALMLIISTAGVDAEKSPCFKEYEVCKQILERTIIDERYCVVIREMDPEDNEHDPANWIKANPLRAATPEGLAILKEEHDRAFDSRDPAKIRTFRIKILNKWVYDNDRGYIGEYLADWDNLAILDPQTSTPAERVQAFSELTKGLLSNVGFDLSKRIDLTADGFLFVLPDGRLAVTAHGFIPEAGAARHEKTDRIPYRDWAADGWLSITGGDVTDYNEIRSHIADRELENDWKVNEVCYDPYNATHLATEMTNDGYVCVEIRQGVQTLSEPTKLFRELVAQGKIVHDGSPLLKWCLANAKEKIDSNENIKLTKENKDDTQRIDLLAALINAMVRLDALKDSTTPSVYSSRGIRTV